jgi:hypothetical protein
MNESSVAWKRQTSVNQAANSQEDNMTAELSQERAGERVVVRGLQGSVAARSAAIEVCKS